MSLIPFAPFVRCFPHNFILITGTIGFFSKSSVARRRCYSENAGGRRGDRHYIDQEFMHRKRLMIGGIKRRSQRQLRNYSPATAGKLGRRATDLAADTAAATQLSSCIVSGVYCMKRLVLFSSCWPKP